MSEWTSIKDRLPDEKQSKITHDFEYVLCATTFGEVRAYKFGTPIGWSGPHFWHGAEKMDEYVTHWMPFPDMPVQTQIAREGEKYMETAKNLYDAKNVDELKKLLQIC